MSSTITLAIGGTLDLVLRAPPAEPQIRCIVTVTYGEFTARGENMAYKLPVTHYVVVGVAYVDAGNNPAVVDGEVRWEIGNPVLGSVHPTTGDSFSCAITPSGTVGATQVSATADADLGTGIR